MLANGEVRFDEPGAATAAGGPGATVGGGGNFFGDIVTIIGAATALVAVTVVLAVSVVLAVTVVGIALGGPTTVYVTEGWRKCRGPDTTGAGAGGAGTRTGATGARCKKWPEPLVCRPFTT